MFAQRPAARLQSLFREWKGWLPGLLEGFFGRGIDLWESAPFRTLIKLPVDEGLGDKAFHRHWR